MGEKEKKKEKRNTIRYNIKNKNIKNISLKYEYFTQQKKGRRRKTLKIKKKRRKKKNLKNTDLCIATFSIFLATMKWMEKKRFK